MREKFFEIPLPAKLSGASSLEMKTGGRISSDGALSGRTCLDSSLALWTGEGMLARCDRVFLRLEGGIGEMNRISCFLLTWKEGDDESIKNSDLGWSLRTKMGIQKQQKLSRNSEWKLRDRWLTNAEIRNVQPR